MRLHEVASLLSLNLKVEASCLADLSRRPAWSAKFDYVEVKDGPILTSAYGLGNTPRQAMLDYIKQITGKDLVYHACSTDRRREFKIPAGVKP